MKSMGWTDQHTLQQIDPYRPADQQHDSGAANAQQPPSMPQTGPNAQMPAATKPAPFLPPMKCCCSKCCCNCGMVFRDDHDVDKPSGQHQRQQQQHQRPKPAAHPMRKDHHGGNSSGQGGGVELVPLLARRRAKQQTTALSSTDVTKIPNPSK